jgi:Na+/proline symporter
MVMISKQENITSIADFIAARYGKSQPLAVVVALVCLVGVLPYIALQLKGIVLGVNLLSGAGAGANGTGAQDTALIVSLVLALFTILFGTRNLDVTEHHRGMVLAIAFESLVKLLAFLAVGAFVTYGLYNGFGDLFDQAKANPELESFWAETVNWPAMMTQTGLAMIAIICLPRQFHVTVVENIEPKDLRLARWVFPAYLILAALFVVPIALAGQMLLPAGVTPDSFVISLPLSEAHPALAMLAFISGHRHGDCRLGGAVDDDFQRHAAALASAPAEHRAAVRGLPPLDADRTPGKHCADPAAGLRVLPPAGL